MSFCVAHAGPEGASHLRNVTPMSAVILQKKNDPKLAHALFASAGLHLVIIALGAFLVTRVTVPVEVPLSVTWIAPVVPPPKAQEPGGSSGPPPKPAAPPKPALPKPPPRVAARPRPPIILHPEPAKAHPKPAPSPPSNSLSARVDPNEYVDLSRFAGTGGGKGTGVGRGRGSGLGDGVEAGVAPRRPVVYLSRSMWQPDKRDLEVYDKMFWHVVDHWPVPASYRGRKLLTSINVRFDREGRITKFKFVRKSGDPAYDDTVIEALVASNPLPRPTEEFYQRFFDSGVDFVLEPKEIYFYSWPDPYEKKKRRFGF
jgi:hypothetical protein